MERIKIARIATVPFALLGSRSILRAVSEQMDLKVICSEGEYFEVIQDVLNQPIIKISIYREIKPFHDLLSIFNLFKIFRKNKFIIVHSNTPKAGLITSISAFLARVPIRCHTFTGQRWTTLNGYKRLLLIFCDKLICLLNNHLYADSFSQIAFLEKMNIVKPGMMKCLGNGGFSGIDATRFSRQRLLKNPLPEWYSKCSSQFKIGFVGRIVREKGIEILLENFKLLKESGFDVALILIGPFEPHLDPIEQKWIDFINNSTDIIQTGFLKNPEEALVYCNVCVLPSFREGFPMVVLESGLLEIPSVVSNIPGNADTVIDSQTGLYFDLQKPFDLSAKLEVLIRDKELLRTLGLNASQRVKEFYSESKMQNYFIDEYTKLVSDYEKTF